MADHAPYVDGLNTDANAMPAAWCNDVNNQVYRGVNPSYVTSTGGANAYVVTLVSSLLTTLAAGQCISFKASFANTAAATLTLVGSVSTGAIAVQVNQTALTAGAIKANDNVTVCYLNGVWNLVPNRAAASVYAQSDTGAIETTTQAALRQMIINITLCDGATTNDKLDQAFALADNVFVPEGTYAMKPGSAYTMPNGKGIYGVGAENMQGGGTIFTRTGADYASFFVTDSSDSAFAGVTFSNFTISGGGSATAANVAAKWAIRSHYPFTVIQGVHVEGTDLYFGNGFNLHNDGALATMGAWMSRISNCRVIGTDGTNPTNNGLLACELDINGGNIVVENCNFGYFDAGLYVVQGENIVCWNVQLNNLKCGAAADRTSAAVVVGAANANSGVGVKGFVFNGYMEAVGRAFLFNECRGATIDGGYYNAFRGFSPSGGTDGFIYIKSAADNVIIKGAYVESQYNLPDIIYSESDYVSEGNFLFLNCTTPLGVPDTYFGNGVYGGVLPTKLSDIAVTLTAASATSGAVTGAVASGSLIIITEVAHGRATGDYVYLAGVGGITNVNLQLWKLTVVSVDTYTLDGSLFAGTYTAGGTAYYPSWARWVAPKFTTNARLSNVQYNTVLATATWSNLAPIAASQDWRAKAYAGDAIADARTSVEVAADTTNTSAIDNVFAPVTTAYTISFQVSGGYIQVSHNAGSNKRIIASAQRLL